MSRINFSSIPTKSKGQACIEMVELLKKHVTDDAVITGLSEKLKNLSEDLISSMGPKNENELTMQLSELDEKRDDSFRALIYGLQFHTHLPNVENKTKAEEILNYILPDTMAFLAAPYMEESSLLAEKIDYLENEVNSTFISSANLTDVVTLLKETNNQFNDLYHQRITEKSNRPAPMRKKSLIIDSILRSIQYYMIGSQYDDSLIKTVFEPLINAKKYKSLPETPESN